MPLIWCALTVLILFVLLEVGKKRSNSMSAEPHGLTSLKQVVQGNLPSDVHVYLIWDNQFYQVMHARALGQERVGCQVRTASHHNPIRAMTVNERALVILSAEDLLNANVQDTIQKAKGVAHPDYGRAGDAAPGFTATCSHKPGLYDDALPWFW
jgi:hypothetical protein